MSASGANEARRNAPANAAAPRTGVCQFYLSGMCKFGTQCRFLHPADLAPSNRPSVPPAPNSGARSQANQPNTAPDSFSLDAVEASLPKTAVPCKFFLQGMCARGTACRFAHVQSASTTTEDCPICMTPITPPKMFGLLSDCDHVICLDCIREWRKSDNMNESKYACPVCRTGSKLVIPSAVYVKGSEKNEMRAAYISRLAAIPCKHFNYGQGRCPFAPECHYAHLTPSGELAVDENGLQSAGRPRKPRRNRLPPSGFRASRSERRILQRLLTDLQNRMGISYDEAMLLLESLGMVVTRIDGRLGVLPSVERFDSDDDFDYIVDPFDSEEDEEDNEDDEEVDYPAEEEDEEDDLEEQALNKYFEEHRARSADLDSDDEPEYD